MMWRKTYVQQRLKQSKMGPFEMEEASSWNEESLSRIFMRPNGTNNIETLLLESLGSRVDKIYPCLSRYWPSAGHTTRID